MLSSDWIKVIANWSYLKAEEAKYLGVFCVFDSILKSAREGAARQLTQPRRMLMAGSIWNSALLALVPAIYLIPILGYPRGHL